MAGTSTSSRNQKRVLDLDKIELIGHPIWEVCDPEPDFVRLLKRFSYHFFNNDLRYVEDDGKLYDNSSYPYPVTLKLSQFNEKEKKDAGMAIPPTVKDERKKVVEGQILLNNLIMPHVTRKERIETLLHEMIHVHLIASRTEDEDDPHGPAFVKKMEEINKKGRVNITITHDYFKNGTNVAKRKMYLWRCTSRCWDTLPYLGFIITRTPAKPNDSHCNILIESCKHTFHRYEDATVNRAKPLQSLECFQIIQTCFGSHNVEIKSKYVDFKDINENTVIRGFNISMDGEHTLAQVPNELDSFTEPETEVIEDRYFLNYDPINQRLVNLGKLQEKYNLLVDGWELSPVILCMHCEQETPKNHVIEHLNKCFGLEFKVNENLPAYKVNFAG